MFKDKALHSIVSYWHGNMKQVERIYKEPETVYSHFSKLSNVMTPIIGNLVLGNACDASFFTRLEENNIGAIINVTKEIPNYFENYFNYYKIPIDDQNHEQITNEMADLACEFIDKYTSSVIDPRKKNILIHCYMGSSRSATFTSIYMIYKYGYSVDDCIQLLRSKRGIVNINTNFREILDGYYTYRMNLSEQLITL